jgi:ABC-2 type transport system permease protein
VFEGMRGVLLRGEFSWTQWLTAFELNVVYLAAGCALFAWAVRHARNRGLLLQMGE